MDKGLREFEPAPHSSRIGPDQVVGPVREVHDREHLVGFILRVCNSIEPGKKEDIFAPGQLDVHGHVLRDVTEPFSYGLAFPYDIVAAD